MLSCVSKKVNCILEFLSVETDFSQSHFLISRMRFPILSCLRLSCLLVELGPEAPLPQTGLVQIISIHQPRLQWPVLSSLLPPGSFHRSLLTHSLEDIKHQTALCICLPGSISLPLPQTIPPNSPHPHSLCFPRAQQPSPQKLCTKRFVQAHIYTTAPTRSLEQYDPGHWAWLGLYVLSSVWHRAEH